jgi:hypothetical protein
MNGREYRYMLELKSMDDIHNGLLWARIPNHDAVRDRLIGRGWVRVQGHNPYTNDPQCFLTTRGLKAVCREAAKRARALCSEEPGGG